MHVHMRDRSAAEYPVPVIIKFNKLVAIVLLPN